MREERGLKIVGVTCDRVVWPVAVGVCVGLLCLACASSAQEVPLEGPQGEALFGIEVSPQITKTEHGYKGVKVLRVLSGSTAEQIGVQKDDVVFKICGKSINNLTDLVDGLVRIRPDKKNVIRVARGGEGKIIEFTSRDTYFRRDNYLFFVLGKHNRYASRTDIVGIIYNEKHIRCIAEQSVLLFIYSAKRIGRMQKITVLGFITSKHGEIVPFFI